MTTKVVHWIETELAKHYKDVDLCEGVDLDRNGAIEGSEKTDQDGDGNVDSAEWQKFVGDNRAALEKLGGHFKAYYSAGTAFKPDNPIHDLLSIESEPIPLDKFKRTYGRDPQQHELIMASQEELGWAYETLEKVFCLVRENLSKREYNPQEKLGLVYDTMEEVGIKFDHRAEPRLIGNINAEVLDCDTSSLVVLTIAHEFDWPVHLVAAPNHMFVRWDDGEGERFNMDFGVIHSDEYYLERFNIHRNAIRQGVYMINWERDDMMALAYWTRGKIKKLRFKDKLAIEDYDKAIGLNPRFIGAYYSRGLLKGLCCSDEEAIEDMDKVLDLNPNEIDAYNTRAEMRRRLGMDEEAKEDEDKAVKLTEELIERQEAMNHIPPSRSCLCEAPGGGPASSRSLLSLLLMLFD